MMVILSKEETRLKCKKCGNEVFWLVKQGVLKRITEGNKLDLKWEHLYEIPVCSKCGMDIGVVPANNEPRST